MNIELRKTENGDGFEENRIFINGMLSAEIVPLFYSPKDATIEENILGGEEILALMREAYVAGRNFEKFKVSIKDERGRTEGARE